MIKSHIYYLNDYTNGRIWLVDYVKIFYTINTLKLNSKNNLPTKALNNLPKKKITKAITILLWYF